jgi:hypothetical protein
MTTTRGQPTPNTPTVTSVVDTRMAATHNTIMAIHKASSSPTFEEPTDTTDITSTSTDNNNDDGNTMTCMVCWTVGASAAATTSSSSNNNNNDINKRSFVTLPCNHSGCYDCIKGWIERCELNGLDVSTCPQCRMCIDDDVAYEILGGRTYTRVSQAPQTVEDALLVDDLTQDWLDAPQNDTHQCTNCGMYTIREDDDPDDPPPPLVACGFCGHIYCWTCNEDINGNDDDASYYNDDTHDHTEFFDPTTQIMFLTTDANKFPVATYDDLQNDDMMENFKDRRQTAINTYQRNRYERTEPAGYVFLTSLFDECTEPAEYVFLTSLFDNVQKMRLGL